MVYGYLQLMQFKLELFKNNNLSPYKKHTSCVLVHLSKITVKKGINLMFMAVCMLY